MHGAIAPDQSRWRGQRHHGLSAQNYASLIWRQVARARKRWLAGDKGQAAFRFGVASHFAADALVPAYSAGVEEAKEAQRAFEVVERSLVPPRVTRPNVAGKQVAVGAIADFLNTARPVTERNGEGLKLSCRKRLALLYKCLLLLGFAVTEQEAPEQVLRTLMELRQSTEQRLRDTAAAFVSRSESAYQRSLHSALDNAAHEFAQLYARKRWRISVAASALISEAVHPQVIEILGASARYFTGLIEDGVKAEEFKRACQSCYDSAVSQVHGSYNGNWFRVDLEAFERELKLVVARHVRAGQAVVSSLKARGRSHLETLATECAALCLMRFPTDWKETLAHKITEGEWDVWVYLVPWLLLGLATPVLWALSLVPFGLVFVAATVSLMCGLLLTLLCQLVDFGVGDWR